MSVRQAQAQIDSAEFASWIAFYRLEPWGAPVEDMRTGATLAMMANLKRDPSKRKEPFGLMEFVSWSGDKPAESEEDAILLSDPKEQAALMRATLFRRG